MKISSEAQVAGREGIEVIASVKFSAEVVKTGGRVTAPMGAVVGIISDKTIEKSLYRNLTINPKISFCPEQRDPKGVVKWAPDDIKNE